MKNKMFMTYIQVIEKRLERKKNQLNELERTINDVVTSNSVEKRKFIELKAVIQELENVLDIATTMCENENEST